MEAELAEEMTSRIVESGEAKSSTQRSEMHESSTRRAVLLGICIEISIRQIERHAHHIMSRSSLRTLRSCFLQIARRIISVSVSPAEIGPARPSLDTPVDMSPLALLTRFMNLLKPIPRRVKEEL